MFISINMLSYVTIMLYPSYSWNCLIVLDMHERWGTGNGMDYFIA